MKLTHHIIICTTLLTPLVLADPTVKDKKASPAEIIEKHGRGAKQLANEQDELSADVQDLIDEQTDAKVIELLREVENIMADATDQLEKKNTGGTAIAIQTEVIEKIFEAAKKKQEQSQQQQSEGEEGEEGEGEQPGEGQGQGQGQGGMMEMLKRMMDGGQDKGEGQQPGEGEGEQPGQGGDQAGQGGGGKGGQTGGNNGKIDNTAEGNQRRVPKNSGNSGSTLPREFQKAMDAYNKGAAKKSNQR